MKYNELIREARKKANMTLEELSRKSGVRVATISNLENNKGNPTVKTLEKISEALDIDLFKD